MITRFFVDVACDLPERRAGALFLEFANAAVSWVGQIIPGSAIMDGSRGPQKPTVRTDIDVARSVVSEIEAREPFLVAKGQEDQHHRRADEMIVEIFSKKTRLRQDVNECIHCSTPFLDRAGCRSASEDR